MTARAPKGGTRPGTVDRWQEPGRTAVLVIAGSSERGGLASGQRLVTVESGVEIGRADEDVPIPPKNTWLIPDPLVSSHHARITRVRETWQIEDAGSMNGTFVRGRRVREPVALADGDVVFVGHHAAVFRRITHTELTAIAEESREPFGPVPTASPKLAALCRRMRLLAPSAQEILLSGETGVGKEVFARAIHGASGRTGRFAAINCAAIPRELLESELYGYVKGAHSMAAGAKAGLIESAAGGTLFLDEIGEMSHEAQAKLLRFLQEREFTPLGSTTARKLDIRVLAATSRADRSDGGGLRRDLAMRLGSTPIRLPPLRERAEDVGVLFAHFMQSAGPRKIAASVFHALLLYGWPGNVRELEKVAREAAVLAQGEGRLTLEHLPPGLGATLSPDEPADEPPAEPPAADDDDGPGRKPRRPAPPREELEALLARFHGNVHALAESLDRQPSVVWRWLARHGLEPDRFRSGS